jgi:tetratricopeptide (TPR) repeat protein
MVLGKAWLEGNCRFSGKHYMQLLDRMLEKPFSQPSSHYKMLLYKAQVHWEMGEQQEAISTLSSAQSLFPENPVLVFLMTEWQWKQGHYKTARQSYGRAVLLANKSGRDYSDLIDSVKLLLSCSEGTTSTEIGEDIACED